MIHRHRTFCVGDEEDIDVLAAKITGQTWTLCTGFRYRDLVFLNDSTSEDAIQEYAVVRESDLAQVESFTVGWMKPPEFRRYVEQLGDFSGSYGTIRNRIESPQDHRRCPLCA